MSKFILGPYIENGNGWDLPVGVSSGIDLRSLTDMGAPSVGQRNIAIFVAQDDAVFSNDYLDLGGGLLNEIILSSRDRNTIADMLGIGRVDLPNDSSLSDVIWHRLTLLSDPDGATGPLPLVPGRNRRWKIILGGQTIEKRFSMEAAEYSKLRDILRRNYSKIKNDPNLPPGHYLKYLGSMTRKYFGHFQNERYRELLGNETDERPVRPTTTVSDDFNRADESLDAGNWIEEIGGWSVVSNAASCVSDAGINTAVYSSDLSGDDHYAQITLVNSSRSGIICRKGSVSDETHYAAREGGSSLYRIIKTNGGLPANLATSENTANPGDILKLEVDGSNITFFLNSVENLSITDSDITGNLKVGIIDEITTSSAMDDFEASDEGFGSSFPVLAMYYYRKRRLYR